MQISEEIKQEHFISENHKAFINIIYTNNVITTKTMKIFKSHGLTAPQYNVLRILRGQNNKPITINGIIQRMLDRQSNASRIVDKLEMKGLAKRKRSEFDKRALDIVITTEGLKLVEKVSRFLDMEDKKNSPLTEEEAEQLNFLLDKFRTNTICK